MASGMSRADRDKWNAKYRAGEDAGVAPHPWIAEVVEPLAPGDALDVAGGAGRHALWLASRGWRVMLVDVSEVALAIAEERAAAAHVPIATQRADLAIEPLPPGPFDLVLCVNYLERRLFPAMAGVLAPGGLFVFVQPTVTNLERNARPSRRFLIEPGEAERLVTSAGLAIVRLEESWRDDRHEARVLAKK